MPNFRSPSTRCTRAALEGEGRAFNKVGPAPFQAALKSSGFYKQAQEQFGAEAWALRTKYTGSIGLR